MKFRYIDTLIYTCNLRQRLEEVNYSLIFSFVIARYLNAIWGIESLKLFRFQHTGGLRTETHCIGMANLVRGCYGIHHTLYTRITICYRLCHIPVHHTSYTRIHNHFMYSSTIRGTGYSVRSWYSYITVSRVRICCVSSLSHSAILRTFKLIIHHSTLSNSSDLIISHHIKS